MPKVLLSTLQHISNRYHIPQHTLNAFIAEPIPQRGNTDILVDISDAGQQWINEFLKNIDYPSCSICNKSLCANKKTSLCHCRENRRLINIFRKEYKHLLFEMKNAEEALAKLQNVPFRQSRNAYGFSTGIFGGINLIFSNLINIATLSSGAVVGIAAAPAVILGGYVYYRGYKEEQKIIADAQADLTAKKIQLMEAHKESVIQRYNNRLNLRNHLNIDDVQLTPTPKTQLKLPKEKRSSLGNPLGHFIISTFSTLSLLSVIILKFGVIAALLGGPITWGIAVTIAVGVGAYFAYNRYCHLEAKKKFDSKIALIESRTTDIRDLTHKHKMPENQYQMRLDNQIERLELRETHIRSPVNSLSQSSPSSSKKIGWNQAYPRLFHPAEVPRSKKILDPHVQPLSQKRQSL